MSLKIKSLMYQLASNFKNNKHLWFVDILLVLSVYAVILMVAFSFTNFLSIVYSLKWYFVTVAAIYFVALLLSKNYRTLWIHASIRDYIKTAFACFAAGLISIIVAYFIKNSHYYLKFSLVSMFFSTLLIVVSRITIKCGYIVLKQHFARKNGKSSINILVIGAGSAAAMFLDDVLNSKRNYNIVGLIDDNERKVSSYVNGKKVLGSRYDIVRVCQEYCVEEIILAIPGISNTERKKIIEICTETKCKIKTLPSAYEYKIS